MSFSSFDNAPATRSPEEGSPGRGSADERHLAQPEVSRDQPAAETHAPMRHPSSPQGHRSPGFIHRIYSVWLRHVRVYARNLTSNSLPPFLEPLIFLVGIGLGLGEYVQDMNGLPYIQYLASGILVTTAMFTSAFECSFGTFIRLEFDKVYQGMLGAPVTAYNVILGEIVWAGTKGLFFTLSVVVVVAAFGLLPVAALAAAPLVGLLTGVMFGCLSLFIASFVKTINHFNFYFSGFISPMFFFAGVVFPVENLPPAVYPISEALPLTHAVRLVRAFVFNDFAMVHLWDISYIVLFIGIFGALSMIRLRTRLVD